MKCVLEYDNLMRAVLFLRAPFASQLDRSFVGLGSTVRKENAIEPGQIREHSSKPAHRFVVEGGTDIDDLSGLSGERVAHQLRRVSQRIYGPALDEIEISPAIYVVQPRSFATDEGHFGPCRDEHQCIYCFHRVLFSISDLGNCTTVAGGWR